MNIEIDFSGLLRGGFWLSSVPFIIKSTSVMAEQSGCVCHWVYILILNWPITNEQNYPVNVVSENFRVSSINVIHGHLTNLMKRLRPYGNRITLYGQDLQNSNIPW